MMPVLAAQPAIPPLHAAVAEIDKPWLGDMVILDPVFPVVDPPPPTAPLHKEIHVVLNQAVQPAPFNFPPALHSYIFQGITPGSDGGGLTLYGSPWKAPSTSHTVFHTYLQDKSRPDRVLIFPDQFKIARTQELPLFKPYIKVRVASTAVSIRLEHPADCLGDTGAASGLLLTVLAALEQQHTTTAPTLVWAASDRELRAATLLR